MGHQNLTLAPANQLSLLSGINFTLKPDFPLPKIYLCHLSQCDQDGREIWFDFIFTAQHHIMIRFVIVPLPIINWATNGKACRGWWQIPRCPSSPHLYALSSCLVVHFQMTWFSKSGKKTSAPYSPSGWVPTVREFQRLHPRSWLCAALRSCQTKWQYRGTRPHQGATRLPQLHQWLLHQGRQSGHPNDQKLLQLRVSSSTVCVPASKRFIHSSSCTMDWKVNLLEKRHFQDYIWSTCHFTRCCLTIIMMSPVILIIWHSCLILMPSAWLLDKS